MMSRMTKVAAIICGLAVFLIISASLICFYSAQNSIATQQAKWDDFVASKSSKFVSGIIPHHELAQDLSDKFWQALKKDNLPRTIVILSPDHFKSGIGDNRNSLLTVSKDTLAIQNVRISAKLLSSLSADKFVFDTSAVELDHGIVNLLAAIKRNSPESEILPVLVPANLERKSMIDFIQELTPEDDIFILASVDFSHYLPQSAADLHDLKSQRVIIDFEVDQFVKLDVDCWQCVYGARLFSSLNGLDEYQIIGKGNSAQISGDLQSDSTTSYFSVLFGNGVFQDPALPRPQTWIFGGDAMFDRGVKILMDKNSLYYPWEKIKLLLRGVDYSVLNLEGPITLVKKQSSLKPGEYSFNFNPEILAALKDSGVNFITLANNHTLNQGQSGLEETRHYLEENKFFFSGDPWNCGPDQAWIGDEVVLLALNDTFPSGCSDQEMAQTVKTLSQAESDYFLIINLHWGVEYQTKNSKSQQDLARMLIDNGADLIIGHHPHVVQNIEEYKNKLVFYSLGNFIFDQYFSENTQKGLAVGLEIYDNRQIYRLFPVNVYNSQPELMVTKQANEFLEQLATESSGQIAEQIKAGIIEISN